MSGTYGGIQTPLKSGLPLCSRGGPAGSAGRVEAPDAGGPWAALNETLEATVSTIAATIAERNRDFTGCLHTFAACFNGSSAVGRQAGRPQRHDSAANTATLACRGRPAA